LYAIKRTRAISTVDASRTAYCALFESHLRYGIAVWGAASKIRLDRVLILQKHAVRVLAELEQRVSCRTAFKELKIMTVVNLYISEVILLANKRQLARHRDHHNCTTRHGGNFDLQGHKRKGFEKKLILEVNTSTHYQLS